MIRPATANDAEVIARIYNHYILHTPITFEERAVSAQEIAERMAKVAALSLPWVVAESTGQVVGYAYAAEWRARSAYRFTVEVTVYLDQPACGQGWGSKLYEAMFPLLKERGIHAVVAGITLPNPASIALHEKFGLTKAAHFKEVGFKFGKWLDVGYWQGVL